jgi:hypothetical protein
MSYQNVGETQAREVASRAGLERLLLVALLVWAVAASAIAAYTYRQAEELRSELSSAKAALSSAESELRGLRARVVLVNVAIDYGNGTIKWFNSTPLPQGATVLTALLCTASRVGYTYGAYGAYVKSVDGVEERIVSKSEGYSWLWYIFKGGKWEMGAVAADAYKLSDGDAVMWRYEHWKF